MCAACCGTLRNILLYTHTSFIIGNVDHLELENGKMDEVGGDLIYLNKASSTIWLFFHLHINVDICKRRRETTGNYPKISAKTSITPTGSLSRVYNYADKHRVINLNTLDPASYTSLGIHSWQAGAQLRVTYLHFTDD